MKKVLPFLLEKNAKMSGDKKIRLGLTLSQTVRKIKQDGITAMKILHGNRSRITS